MVVMPDADLELAVEGALFSGFGTAGQRCTSLGTAIVHESVHDEFLARLAGRLETAVIGDPFGDVLYGPMLDGASRIVSRSTSSALIAPAPPPARLDRNGTNHLVEPARRASSVTPMPASSATRRSSPACAPTTSWP